MWPLPHRPAAEASPSPFRLCLNTATLQGFKRPIAEQVELAARAGYAGIEPWIRELDQHAADGGSLDDLGKKIRDLGLVVPSAIGFFEWGVDDDAQRAKGLEEARRSMEVVRSIGGLRIAAPPSASLTSDAAGSTPDASSSGASRTFITKSAASW